MKSVVVGLHDQAVELRYAEDLEPQIELLFGQTAPAAVRPWRILSIQSGGGGRYSLNCDGHELYANLSVAELTDVLLETAAGALIEKLDSAVALHAASIGWGNSAVLIAGPTGAGKSSLAGYLVDSGFEFMSDELSLLHDNGEVEGFLHPLLAKAGADALIARLTRSGSRLAARTAASVAIRCVEGSPSRDQRRTPALIVLPHYVADADFELVRVSPVWAAFRLMECNLNGRNLTDHGLHELTELARKVPAVALTYGNFQQLHRFSEFLAKFSVRPEKLESLVPAFNTPPQPAAITSVEAPAMTALAEVDVKPANAPKLTIGMATFDDYDGVYFTIQAIRMYHAEILDDVEFLVIDNNPTGPSSQGLQDLQNWIPNYRYMPRVAVSGTAIRDYVFREAHGEFVLCIDCHIMVVAGALRRLLDYFIANPGTPDLLQGPLIYDDLKSYSSHFKPGWEHGMYGAWDTEPAGADSESAPFEIPMQGLGLFACRRSAWPSFNPAFRGFGGEEGYIHEKFRQRGGKAICLPFLRWMHRFHRPRGVPYVNIWEDRVWNYLVGFRELGWETGQIVDHFKKHLGEKAWDRVVERLGPEVLGLEPGPRADNATVHVAEVQPAQQKLPRSDAKPRSEAKPPAWLKTKPLPFGAKNF